MIAKTRKTKALPEVQLHDQARAEIEVASNEILKYLMKTSIRLFERESTSLTKAFEMSNLQMQAYIHPV